MKISASKKAAVIGSPISHSLSPAIFGFVAKHLGLVDFQYTAREVGAQEGESELRDFLREVRSDSAWVGLNVTIPHKQRILKLVDTLSEEASAVAAVNVVEIRQGRLRGHNTDVRGITETIASRDCRLQDESVWIWGAGGAARAMAFVAGKQGATEVYLSSRSIDRAETLAKSMAVAFPKTHFHPLAPKAAAMNPLRLLVNATPVGTKSNTGGLEIFAGLGELPRQKGTLAFDLVYNPEETPFLSFAANLGLKTESGLRMLIEQALATWQIWFGPVEAITLPDLKRGLFNELRDRLGPPMNRKPVFLTGFMGTGKSTVGATLAHTQGWKFIDIDQQIEGQAHLSIAEIFERDGEARFRELEEQAVHAAIADAKSERRLNTVVALGGGALVNPEILGAVQRVGTLVALNAGVTVLARRLAHGAAKRPLLAGASGPALELRIEELLTAREPIYAQARLRIETGELNPDEVAKTIADRLQYESQAAERGN
ncbi:MAG: shikimate kinase [Bdellovibrionota bacterium]